jgi:hypothetical protein
MIRRHAPGFVERLRLITEEQITHQRNRIGKIKASVGLPVEEFDVRRVPRLTLSAREEPGPEKQELEDTDRVGHFDQTVLIAVSRQLLTETSGNYAEEHRRGAGITIGNRDIGQTVLVKVSGGDAVWNRIVRSLHCPKLDPPPSR